MRPKIALLTTGGTIACRLNEFGALVPMASGSELVSSLPPTLRDGIEVEVDAVCCKTGW